jgi:hypothetical protein
VTENNSVVTGDRKWTGRTREYDYKKEHKETFRMMYIHFFTLLTMMASWVYI